MEALPILVFLIVGLLVLGLVAMQFGVDTRDAFVDDRRR